MCIHFLFFESVLQQAGYVNHAVKDIASLCKQDYSKLSAKNAVVTGRAAPLRGWVPGVAQLVERVAAYFVDIIWYFNLLF